MLEYNGRVASLREAPLPSGFLKRTPACHTKNVGYDICRIVVGDSKVCQETNCCFRNRRC